MQETTVRHWKKILEAIAARNRNRLGEREYIALAAALEVESDPRALRKLAIDTATALGRLDGRLLSPPSAGTSNLPHQEQSPETKLAAPAMTGDMRVHSTARAPHARTRRSPTLP